MGKVWVLDTGTKGTGAQMVPLEKALEKQAPDTEPAVRRRARRPARSDRPAPAAPVREPKERSSGPLPPGHVRKKATGELGRIQAVDAKAGTATVRWLKQGRTSTVPLTAISRR
jgi:hypothetical protein